MFFFQWRNEQEAIFLLLLFSKQEVLETKVTKLNEKNRKRPLVVNVRCQQICRCCVGTGHYVC